MRYINHPTPQIIDYISVRFFKFNVDFDFKVKKFVTSDICIRNKFFLGTSV